MEGWDGYSILMLLSLCEQSVESCFAFSLHALNRARSSRRRLARRRAFITPSHYSTIMNSYGMIAGPGVRRASRTGHETMHTLVVRPPPLAGLPGSEAELHLSVLTRSCPTLTRMFAAACGAGMLPMQLNWQKHDPTVPVVIQIVGFSALGISLVATYLAGVVALCSHTRGGDADKTTAQAAWEAGGGAALRAARDNPAT